MGAVPLLCCSLERYIILTADDTAAPPNVTLPSGPLHPNLVWPTPSGITESEARSICQAPILEATAVFELCRNYTMESLEVITESCMIDMLV